MERHFAKLMTLAATIGAVAAVGLSSAGAAQAHCVSNDKSGECVWTFPQPNTNSPNLIAQSPYLYVAGDSGTCYTGYYMSGGSWHEGGPMEQCVGSSGVVSLFNTVTPGQTEHVLENSGPDGEEVTIAF